MMLLIAEATGINTDNLPSILSAIGSIGFAVWYGWYVTTKTIPKITDKHDERIATLVQDFREEKEADRLAFKEALERVACKYQGH